MNPETSARSNPRQEESSVDLQKPVWEIQRQSLGCREKMGQDSSDSHSDVAHQRPEDSPYIGSARNSQPGQGAGKEDFTSQLLELQKLLLS